MALNTTAELRVLIRNIWKDRGLPSISRREEDEILKRARASRRKPGARVFKLGTFVAWWARQAAQAKLKRQKLRRLGVR